MSLKAVVPCCLCVIHVGVVPGHLSRDRQGAAAMHPVASAPTKACGSTGCLAAPRPGRVGRGKGTLGDPASAGGLD